ncbi:hypothetical protein [Corynebacterium sp. sy039]|uniref:hypothetical protein n=1 Tax=Corynebacterium sp. sy039 TaxID=2599641 RepID=UPI0011B80447|nr:hypothetical protein [Corynebacterium sp. sy039]QDZ42703.1 hypothetical protein FQV43_05695 [Corynebacterium sp. sy039]
MHILLIIITSVVVTLFFVQLYTIAQRLDRLNIRVDSSLQALQAMLDQRAAVLAAIDPKYETIASAAEAVALKYDSFLERSEKERDISAAIAAMGHNMPPRIAEAQARVQLAHRFYNDAVADTRALRRRPLVRIFRLGGTSVMPRFFEFTDYSHFSEN